MQTTSRHQCFCLDKKESNGPNRVNLPPQQWPPCLSYAFTPCSLKVSDINNLLKLG
jgi:hypothetical protein